MKTAVKANITKVYLLTLPYRKQLAINSKPNTTYTPQSNCKEKTRKVGKFTTPRMKDTSLYSYIKP